MLSDPLRNVALAAPKDSNGSGSGSPAETPRFMVLCRLSTEPRLPASVRFVLALTAAPAAVRSDHEVVTRELVTLRTVSLSRVVSLGTRASQDVLSLRDGLKVVRVDTRLDSAQVIYFIPLRYRALGLLVRPAMGVVSLVLVGYRSVPARLARGPEPAGLSLIDSLPESILDRSRWWHPSPVVQGSAHSAEQQRVRQIPVPLRDPPSQRCSRMSTLEKGRARRPATHLPQSVFFTTAENSLRSKPPSVDVSGSRLIPMASPGVSVNELTPAALRA